MELTSAVWMKQLSAELWSSSSKRRVNRPICESGWLARRPYV